MISAWEQELNKAFEKVKIDSTKAGTYGRFGVYWDVKNGRPVLAKELREPTIQLPSEDK